MDLDFIDYELANTVTMFINTCIFLSYPINFGIYCGMSRWILVLKNLITFDHNSGSRQFRETFRVLVFSPLRNAFKNSHRLEDPEDSSGTKNRSILLEMLNDAVSVGNGDRKE